MDKRDSPFRGYLRYSTIGIEMGLSVFVGLFLGQVLDDFFGTHPWLLLLCLLLGMTAGFRGIFLLLRRMKSDHHDSDRSR